MRTRRWGGQSIHRPRTTEDCPLGRQEGGPLEPGWKCSSLLLVGHRPGILPLGTGQLGAEAGG